MNTDNLQRLAEAVRRSDRFDASTTRDADGEPCSIAAIAASLSTGATPPNVAVAEHEGGAWLELTAAEREAMFTTKPYEWHRAGTREEAAAMLAHAAKTDAVVWPVKRAQAA